MLSHVGASAQIQFCIISTWWHNLLVDVGDFAQFPLFKS